MSDNKGPRWCPICKGAKPPDAEICLACYITKPERTAPMSKYQLDAPLATAPPETKKALIDLADIYRDNPARPCCDGQTTLADWLETGLWTPERTAPMTTDTFPQTPEDARVCIHDNKVWFGNECGICDSNGYYQWKQLPTATCRYCSHPIVEATPDDWHATDATGDDSIWREYCPDNDTERAAPHEPETRLTLITGRITDLETRAELEYEMQAGLSEDDDLPMDLDLLDYLNEDDAKELQTLRDERDELERTAP